LGPRLVLQKVDASRARVLAVNVDQLRDLLVLERPAQWFVGVRPREHDVSLVDEK